MRLLATGSGALSIYLVPLDPQTALSVSRLNVTSDDLFCRIAGSQSTNTVLYSTMSDVEALRRVRSSNSVPGTVANLAPGQDSKTQAPGTFLVFQVGRCKP